MPPGERMRKITISMPEELVEYADSWAKELSVSRSQVIGMTLSAVMTREEEQLAADGYLFYAQEAGEFAGATSQAIAGAWTDAWLPTDDEGTQTATIHQTGASSRLRSPRNASTVRPIGQLSPAKMRAVDAALAFNLGL